jgi:hypothetical protein
MPTPPRVPTPPQVAMPLMAPTLPQAATSTQTAIPNIGRTGSVPEGVRARRERASSSQMARTRTARSESQSGRPFRCSEL